MKITIPLVRTALLVCLLLAGGCSTAPRAREAPPRDMLIVLGNEPLDDETPTVDMIARVTKAVDFQRLHPGALLVFTGGRTAGQVSEAAMMWHIARGLGVAQTAVRLEENAASTVQNAEFTADLARQWHPDHIYIVSKGDHLLWALPLFRAIDVFRNAQPLVCEVDRQASIAQMRDYLAHHENARVRQRLQNLQAEVRGVD